MTEALVFALIGLGAGAAYAIAGMGLVQIYRGSGVINFAHGGIAFFTAALYAQFSTDWDWPWVPSFLVALLASVLVGILIQVLVMKPLRDAAVLVRMIATVGVLVLLEQLVPLVLGNITQRAQVVFNYYPKGGITLIEDGAKVTFDRLSMLVIVVIIGVLLAQAMARTRFGLATSAVAEDGLVAQSLRVDPDRVGLVNWAIGGGLAGLAGLLMVPWASLVPSTFILLIVPALVAAMLGGFSSYSTTIFGGVALGVAQSFIIFWQPELPTGWRSGWGDAVPLIVMLIILATRGSVFPRRDEVAASLPTVGRRRLLPLHAVLWGAGLFFVVLLTTEELADAIATTAGLAIVGLSLLVVTGLAGQISLAQMTMAGIGALVAARLSGEAGVPFLLITVIGIVAGVAAGFVFALPAFRTRGPTLAVATLALGLTVEKTIFTNQAISGASFSGVPVRDPDILGWPINAIEYPERYAAVAVVLMIAVMFVVANLRAGPVGRRMLAVRSNERAAAALGISVQRVKLIAFAVSAGLATVGGMILAFKFQNVLLLEFGIVDSLLVVVFTLIGGIGYILGALAGAAISPSGIVAYVFNDMESIERLLIVIGGVIVIIQLIVAPSGIVHDVMNRQAMMGPLREHLSIEPRQWRIIGAVEMAASLAVLVAVVNEAAWANIAGTLGGVAALLIVVWLALAHGRAGDDHRHRIPWYVVGTLGVLFLLGPDGGVLETVSGLVLAVALGIFGYGIVKSTLPRSQEIRYAIDEAETGGRDPAVLVVENLTVRYGSVAAVAGLDLTVSPGQIVGLIGPNGAGKTTAIDAITGFISPADGTVTLGGRQLDEMQVHRRSEAGLGRTFQTVEPFDDLTVAENLAAATERLGVVEWLMSFLRVPRLSLDSLTGRVIDAFDLHSELGHFPSELPQGRRRLLGVARALAANPAVLLLDEPAAGLDAAETRALGEQLRTVANESNVGMLLVEHDMSIVTAICDEVIALDFGKTIFRGTAPDAMEHAGVRASYLGVEVEQAGEPA